MAKTSRYQGRFATKYLTSDKAEAVHLIQKFKKPPTQENGVMAFEVTDAQAKYIQSASFKKEAAALGSMIEALETAEGGATTAPAVRRGPKPGKRGRKPGRKAAKKTTSKAKGSKRPRLTPEQKAWIGEQAVAGKSSASIEREFDKKYGFHVSYQSINKYAQEAKKKK